MTARASFRIGRRVLPRGSAEGAPPADPASLPGGPAALSPHDVLMLMTGDRRGVVFTPRGTRLDLEATGWDVWAVARLLADLEAL